MVPAGFERAMIDLALNAGAKIMEIYESGDMDTQSKADESPVTAADLAADALILAGLTSQFPDVAIVTEEAADSHGQTGLTDFVLVDPLDGTKEFVQRRGEFTVNIAYIEGGTPIAGVVYAPAKGRLFATRDGKSFEYAVTGGDLDEGSMREIRVSSPDNGALAVIASKSHRDQATDDYIARFKVSEFKSAGSSLKFCLLAAGEADFYPRLGRTMEWDTAAGHAVLRAAGGIVLRHDNQDPLTYGKPGYENPFFLALSPEVAL